MFKWYPATTRRLPELNFTLPNTPKRTRLLLKVIEYDRSRFELSDSDPIRFLTRLSVSELYRNHFGTETGSNQIIEKYQNSLKQQQIKYYYQENMKNMNSHFLYKKQKKRSFNSGRMNVITQSRFDPATSGVGTVKVNECAQHKSY